MYHQSVDGCSKWPHMFTFSKKERYLFCDPHLFKLLKLLMIADSGSYNFFSDKAFQDSVRNEFISNNDKMQSEWQAQRQAHQAHQASTNALQK